MSVTRSRRSASPLVSGSFGPDSFVPQFDPSYVLAGGSTTLMGSPFDEEEEHGNSDCECEQLIYGEPDLFSLLNMSGVSKRETDQACINLHDDLENVFGFMYSDCSKGERGERCSMNFLYRYALLYGVSHLGDRYEIRSFIDTMKEFNDGCNSGRIDAFVGDFIRNALKATKPEIEKVRGGKRINIRFRSDNEHDPTLRRLSKLSGQLLITFTSLCHICMWQAVAHGDSKNKDRLTKAQSKLDTFLQEIRCRTKIVYGAIHG